MACESGVFQMVPHNVGDLNAGSKEKRGLSRLSRDSELYPWYGAQALTRCSLYWLPVSSFPMVEGERTWLMRFLDLFLDAVSRQYELRSEVFLHSKSVEALRVSFARSAREFYPILGWSHRPGSKTKPLPTKEEVAAIIDRGEQFDAEGMMPDGCYWFLKKAERKQREMFLGHGGMSIVLLKADRKTQPPQLPLTDAMRKQYEQLSISSLEALIASAFGMKDGFLAKSKQRFGQNLQGVPGFGGIPFILPHLSAQDFFNRPAEECDSWFEIFDIYISESPADRGILLASKIDLQERLGALVERMRNEGLVYNREVTR